VYKKIYARFAKSSAVVVSFGRLVLGGGLSTTPICSKYYRRINYAKKENFNFIFGGKKCLE